LVVFWQHTAVLRLARSLCACEWRKVRNMPLIQVDGRCRKAYTSSFARLQAAKAWRAISPSSSAQRQRSVPRPRPSACSHQFSGAAYHSRALISPATAFDVIHFRTLQGPPFPLQVSPCVVYVLAGLYGLVVRVGRVE